MPATSVTANVGGTLDASAAAAAAGKRSHVQPTSEIKNHDLIMFDNINQQFLKSTKMASSLQENAIGQESLMLESFDGEGKPLVKADVSDAVCPKIGKMTERSSSSGTRGEGLQPEVESSL